MSAAGRRRDLVIRPPSAAEPVSFLRTSWSTDPFALCSYSFQAPSRLGVDMRTMLAEPVDGRVFFAGEATSVDAPATTRGALESGRRAAREIHRTARPGARVVVVGAGFAGLGCAHALERFGFDVQVVEARSRVGGRVWTRRIAGVPVELGASWIHGAERNPMAALLRRSGGRGYEVDYDNIVGGDEAAMAELDEYLEALDDVEDPDVTAVSALLPDPMPAAVQYATNLAYAQEYGCEPAELAVAADQGWFGGGAGADLLLLDGYDRLIAHLQGRRAVQANTVVATVSHTATGVRLGTADGGHLDADAVVLTVPIGVLKASAIEFSPPLPDGKQEAIAALGAGLLDKLWLEFDSVFWDPEPEFIEWRDPDAPGLWSLWLNGYAVFGHPLLLGFNGGAQARALAGATDREVVAGALHALGHPDFPLR
ncbi:FAD-dependent oxidoreductase [Nocardia vermiculata]|uniref:NAD(P)-binding protein n=1 Tax=Nocardia vermiculata TaxID=257274 RepID=A0A846Y7H7_9NOCA|nr:FAD-dependent oxidoreductase [Nocardia vermiculata]NKY54305.1 NAD(P)-binding protein [Nocardia vermiculata]